MENRMLFVVFMTETFRYVSIDHLSGIPTPQNCTRVRTIESYRADATGKPQYLSALSERNTVRSAPLITSIALSFQVKVSFEQRQIDVLTAVACRGHTSGNRGLQAIGLFEYFGWICFQMFKLSAIDIVPGVYSKIQLIAPDWRRLTFHLIFVV